MASDGLPKYLFMEIVPPPSESPAVIVLPNTAES